MRFFNLSKMANYNKKPALKKEDLGTKDFFSNFAVLKSNIYNMELPDFMSYSNKFTNGEFLEKISKIAKRAGAKLVYVALILYYTLQSDKVAIKDKAIIIGALGYLISPLDVIPDAIPIVGLGDDLAVLLYVLNKIGNVSEEIKDKAKAKLNKWFDEDELEEINEIKL